ncbi:unnamed protein product, partial [Prorocentrum cordatum]
RPAPVVRVEDVQRGGGGGRWDVRAHSREFVDDAHHDERHPLQRQGEGAQIHRVHQRPGICDPHVRGPGCCRVERPALRGGLHPLHTGPDPRPLPRVQLQHVRDPRPQIPVPPARGGAGQHQEPQDRLGRRAGLRGHEDDARGLVPAAAVRLAADHFRHPRSHRRHELHGHQPRAPSEAAASNVSPPPTGPPRRGSFPPPPAHPRVPSSSFPLFSLPPSSPLPGSGDSGGPVRVFCSPPRRPSASRGAKRAALRGWRAREEAHYLEMFRI